ncbi:hypothetical protein V1525DRAFT_402285 [Lipomyces kononenkoae]|uniref:Uncharacterized protein n=1 Tax=Lipomyces kononenkoae TaxID=34357 RepID=A0ACC3T2T6_LIPKO
MGDRAPRESAIDDLGWSSSPSLVSARGQTETPPPPPPKSSAADSLEERFNRLRLGGIKLRESRGTDYFTHPVHASESSYSTPSLSSHLSSNTSNDHGATKNYPIAPSANFSTRRPLQGPRELPTRVTVSTHESNRSNKSSLDGVDTIQLLGSLPSVPTALPSVPSSSSTVSGRESHRTSTATSISSLRSSPIRNNGTQPAPTSRLHPLPPSVPPPPPPTNHIKPHRPYNFPRALTVTAADLATYIHEVPDQILLLDIRPREQYDEGHIYSSNIVNIDPIVLRANQTSADLEDALILSPAKEQEIFSRRHKFELIIYYNQSSRTNSNLGGVSDGQQVALHNLIDTIYERETVKCLKRQPCLLVGGIDAWVDYCGRNSLVTTRTATNVAQANVPDKSVDVEVYDVTKDKITMTYEQDYSSLPRKQLREPSDQSQSVKRTPPGKPSTINGNRMLSEFSPSHRIYNASAAPNAVAVVPESDVTVDVYNRDMKDFFRRGPQAPSDLMPKRPTPVVDRLSYNGRISAHSMPVAGTALPSLHPQVANGHAPRASPQTIDLAAQFPQSPTVTRSEKQHSIGNNYSGLGEVSAGLTGLKNLGNTCYMNSVIQCLAGTGLLARFFLTGSYKKHINLKNKLGTKGELTTTFANLVHALYNDQCTFLIPTTMKEVTGRLRPEFAGNDQHDAQEFLTFILDGLHEDLNANGGKARLPPLTEQEERMRERYTVRYASFLEWERYLKSDNSAIVHMFQGQYQSRLTCMECRFTSTTYNPFSFLSLPLAPGKSVTLEQCFDLFVAEEVLDHDDAWYCPQCKQQRKATKALRIARLPVILIIHLKRFKVSGPWSNKLDNFVKFPLRDLDLTRYWPNYRSEDKVWLDKFPHAADQQPPFQYNLYGVVNHYGSVRGGHYTAFAHKNNKGWLIFDDSRVAMCPIERVVSKDAYVLFYERDLSKGYKSMTT